MLFRPWWCVFWWGWGGGRGQFWRRCRGIWRRVEDLDKVIRGMWRRDRVGLLAVAEIASRVSVSLPVFAVVAVKTRWFAGFGVATGGATTGCRRILSRWWSGVNGCCVTCRNKLWSQSSISTVYHGDSIENEHCAVISIFLLSAPVRRLYVASTLCNYLYGIISTKIKVSVLNILV